MPLPTEVQKQGTHEASKKEPHIVQVWIVVGLLEANDPTDCLVLSKKGGYKDTTIS